LNEGCAASPLSTIPFAMRSRSAPGSLLVLLVVKPAAFRIESVTSDAAASWEWGELVDTGTCPRN
jgi:hypothetical protein